MWSLKVYVVSILIYTISAIDLKCQRHPELSHVECNLDEKFNDNTIVTIDGYKYLSGTSANEITDLVLIYKNLPLHMPQGIGKVFQRLVSFDVSSTNVEFIDKDCFNGMDNLSFLRLSHNEIKQLPENVFYGMESLQRIDLSRNKITNLPAKIFSKNVNLTYLKLSENQLEELDADIFENNRGLRKIFLNGNFLTRVSVDFSTFPNLAFLDLLGNGRDCNFRFDKKEMKTFNLAEIKQVVAKGCNKIKLVE